MAGSALCTLVLPDVVAALPEVAEIRFGAVEVRQDGNTVNVAQSSDRAVVDWSRFDVAPGEVIRFTQPTASAAILNRVQGGGASHIDGAVHANGQVYISNPGGIVFGKGAQVNVGSLVATTADIGDKEFAAGGALHFNKPGTPGAAIVNHGSITVQDGGLAALVAPHVKNSGVILAKAGTVALAAGDTATVDFYGDDLLSVAVSGKVKSMSASNSGTLAAKEGGTVLLTTAQAASVIDSAINMDGLVDVSSAYAVGGDVMFTGDEAAIVIGENAVVSASGAHGGGRVRIGGQAYGAAPTPTAKTTTLAKGARIDASATVSGAGGEVIVWADEKASVSGSIAARGGPQGGDGGFVETSGKQLLEMDGEVDLRAPKGRKGQLLLDPTDITVYGDVDPSFISTDGTVNLGSNLVLWMDAGDATKLRLTYSADGVATTASGTLGSHTITTAANVSGALHPGGRIRLGAAGAVGAASVMGGDTYTIASVSGTTITTVESLSQSYAVGTNIYRGLVSEWTDRSPLGNTAIQATPAEMPVFISGSSGTGLNGRNILLFDGVADVLRIADSDSLDGTAGLSFFVVHNQLASNATGGGLFSKRIDTTATNHSYSFFSSSSNALTVDIHTTNNRFTSNIATANGTPRYYSVLYNGALAAANRVNVYLFGSLDRSGTEASASIPNSTAGACIGLLCGNSATYYSGSISEIALYREAVPQLYQHLLDQYHAAKWGIALTPPGTGVTELAKATAADGYSAFSARYLERLSQGADISLQATNNITLDLKGGTMNFATSGRSLTLTAGNQIAHASAGTITTNGGNITMTATAGQINLGGVTLNATGGAVQLTSGGSMTLGAVNAASILAETTGASADITLSGVLSATGAGNAVTLVSGDDFINAAGAGAVSAPAGRWLIYSERADEAVWGALYSNFSQYSCTYGSCVPASTGNGALYRQALPNTGGGGGAGAGGTGVGVPAGVVAPGEAMPSPPAVDGVPLPTPGERVEPAPPEAPSGYRSDSEIPRIVDRSPITAIDAANDVPATASQPENGLLTYTPAQLKQLNCSHDNPDSSCLLLQQDF